MVLTLSSSNLPSVKSVSRCIGLPILCSKFSLKTLKTYTYNVIQCKSVHSRFRNKKFSCIILSIDYEYLKHFSTIFLVLCGWSKGFNGGGNHTTENTTDLPKVTVSHKIVSSTRHHLPWQLQLPPTWVNKRLCILFLCIIYFSVKLYIFMIKICLWRSYSKNLFFS